MLTSTFLPSISDARYALGGEGGLGNVVACEDARHIFIPGYHSMVIIDPDDGYLRSLVNPFAFDEANAIRATDERAVYLAIGAQRFDRDIHRFGPLLPQIFAAVLEHSPVTGHTGAAVSRSAWRPDRGRGQVDAANGRHIARADNGARCSRGIDCRLAGGPISSSQPCPVRASHC